MDSPHLDSERGTPIPPAILPSHDDFVSDDVSYYNANDSMETRVTRCPIPDEPDYDPMANTFNSLDEMLLAGKRKKIDHAAFSHLAVADFKGKVTCNGKAYKVRNDYFHHASADTFEGKQYRDTTGKIHVVHHSITSSWDRSALGSHMAKVLIDNGRGRSNGESICYGGRPDSDSRARTQAEDIFRTEKAGHKKGLIKDPITGEYTLTYVVDSLTNPGKIQNPSHLDERTSLEDEMQALSNLKKTPLKIKIDDEEFTVHVRPIHVHHTLSVFGELGNILPDSLNGKNVEAQINRSGYKSLIAIAEKLAKKQSDPYKKQLIEDTAHQLKNHSLTVSERLILVDFLTRMCDLPIVHHCKSIVDRTSVASSVAIANHFIKHGRLIEDIPIDDNGRFAIHLLLDNAEYKKFFVSFMNINHQVSRDARLGIRPDGSLIGRAALGLNLTPSLFNLNLSLLAATGALPFFPDEAKKPSILTKGTKTRVAALAALALFFPLLLTVYYAALFFGSIPVAMKFKKKTGSYKIDFFKMIWTLPFRVKWLEIRNLNFAETFKLDSPDINGDGRHLLVAAKHLRDSSKADPRYRLIPEHLHPNAINSVPFTPLPDKCLQEHFKSPSFSNEDGTYKKKAILNQFIVDFARDLTITLPEPKIARETSYITDRLKKYLSDTEIDNYRTMDGGGLDALNTLVNTLDQLSLVYNGDEDKIFGCLTLLNQSNYTLDIPRTQNIVSFRLAFQQNGETTTANKTFAMIVTKDGLMISGSYKVICPTAHESRTLETRVYFDKGKVFSRLLPS